MNGADLQNIVEENANGRQEVYGVFDPARIPQLAIQPITNVRDISLAVSPDCSYRLVRDALAKATTTLDIYIYNASADYLLDLVLEARDRHVTVRVMYDVMDTRGNEREKLRKLGVALKEAPSSGRRQVFTVCHQKFVVVDSRSLVIGSANWATTSIPKATVPGKFRKGNREWLVHVKDERVATWFAGLFQADWDIPAMEGPAGALAMPEVPVVEAMETRAAAVSVPEKVFDVESPGLGTGVTVTPILSPDNYFTLVRQLIRNAQVSIDVEQQYIVAGGPKTQALLQELAARKDQVRIRIIVSPAFAKNWDKTVQTLNVAELDDRLRAINLDSFTHLHNKGVLVDGRFTVVTSTNMSENSITQAREAGVLIDSPAIGQYFERVVDVDWKSGLDPADVRARLAEVEATLARVDEPTQTIHPADARMI